jgi:hypothetical protein
MKASVWVMAAVGVAAAFLFLLSGSKSVAQGPQPMHAIVASVESYGCTMVGRCDSCRGCEIMHFVPNYTGTFYLCVSISCPSSAKYCQACANIYHDDIHIGSTASCGCVEGGTCSSNVAVDLTENVDFVLCVCLRPCDNRSCVDCGPLSCEAKAAVFTSLPCW